MKVYYNIFNYICINIIITMLLIVTYIIDIIDTSTIFITYSPDIWNSPSHQSQDKRHQQAEM